MKIALMIVSLLLSGLIGLVLAQRGGGESHARGSGPLIGLSLDTLKEARWQRDRDLFVAAAKAAGARDVLVQAANSDDARQVADIKSLISAGVDVLVIVPHDGAAMARGVELAHEAGIPVIAYDRMITNCDLDLYISFDNVNVGRQQAQYVLDHLPNGKGSIVRIAGSKTDNNAVLFKQGQDEVLGPAIKRGDVTITWDDWAQDWTPENAKRIVDAAITAKGKAFDAVLASNDGTASGAIQALSEEGLAGKVLVTGQDADLVACQRIERGTQTMTIYKPLKRLAQGAAQIAVRMGRRQPVVARGVVNNGKVDVPSVLESTIAVDKANMNATVVKDGFWSEDEIRGESH